MASGCQSPLVWDDPTRSRVTADPAGTTLTVELPPSCMPLVCHREQPSLQHEHPQEEVPLPGAADVPSVPVANHASQQPDFDQVSVTSSTEDFGLTLDGAVKLQVSGFAHDAPAACACASTTTGTERCRRRCKFMAARERERLHVRATPQGCNHLAQAGPTH
jgi:hypothetical protein